MKLYTNDFNDFIPSTPEAQEIYNKILNKGQFALLWELIDATFKNEISFIFLSDWLVDNAKAIYKKLDQRDEQLTNATLAQPQLMSF